METAEGLLGVCPPHAGRQLRDDPQLRKPPQKLHDGSPIPTQQPEQHNTGRQHAAHCVLPRERQSDSVGGLQIAV